MVLKAHAELGNRAERTPRASVPRRLRKWRVSKAN